MPTRNADRMTRKYHGKFRGNSYGLISIQLDTQHTLTKHQLYSKPKWRNLDASVHEMGGQTTVFLKPQFQLKWSGFPNRHALYSISASMCQARQ